MAEEEIECEFGVGGIVLRAAHCERLAVPRERERVNREQHEDIVFEECGNERSLFALQADREGPPRESRTQVRCPAANRSGSMLERESLELLRPCGAQANGVLLVGPVDSDPRSETFVHRGGCGHGSSWSRLSSGACKARPRRQYGEPVARRLLRIRWGQSRTRGLESKLASVTRSALHIRSPRVHVPLLNFSRLHSSRKRTVNP